LEAYYAIERERVRNEIQQDWKQRMHVAVPGEIVCARVWKLYTNCMQTAVEVGPYAGGPDFVEARCMAYNRAFMECRRGIEIEKGLYKGSRQDRVGDCWNPLGNDRGAHGSQESIMAVTTVAAPAAVPGEILVGTSDIFTIGTLVVMGWIWYRWRRRRNIETQLDGKSLGHGPIV
jgi:hypothetical protein